jgi:hypothetical protein
MKGQLLSLRKDAPIVMNSNELEALLLLRSIQPIQLSTIITNI